MSSATGDGSLPSTGAQSSATPGQTTNSSTLTENLEDYSATATNAGSADTEVVPAMPQPPGNAISSIQDADEADTPTAITPAAQMTDPLGAAPRGAALPPRTNGHVVNGAQDATTGPVNDRRGSADPLYARRRTGTGSSNPMVESSTTRAPIVPIPPELLYRSETAPGVPLLNPVPAPLPTSMPSYRRQLSRETLEQVEKQRALNRDAKREH